ncbi:cadherin-24 isoform X2 [Rana temporaria]|uniref:cadherin-24 isoform X2 n=1 Tax=Rana temporaria TaxID=8407 RepID=UPI001AAC8277|nr:cadherin-24 isoform X2 [Rana temporaria]
MKIAGGTFHITWIEVHCKFHLLTTWKVSPNNKEVAVCCDFCPVDLFFDRVCIFPMPALHLCPLLSLLLLGCSSTVPVLEDMSPGLSGEAGSSSSPPQGPGPPPRSKRSWVWNQFFVIEEYAGPEPVLIGRLHTDIDRGEGRAKYILTGEGAGSVFVIDDKTGNIHVTKSLDREEKEEYILLAQAVDKVTLRPLEPPSQFIIKVQDINDNPPVFLHPPYRASVPEMSNVGTSVIQVTASDADDPTYGNSARLVYTVLEGQPYFSVDPQTGVIRTAIPNMDRETQDEFLVVIQAKDMGGHVGGLSGSTTVTVTLTDVNDNPPKFPQSLYQFTVLENTVPGSLIGRLRAYDPDIGENAEMSYSILDGDAGDTFTVMVDAVGQDGILRVQKPLDFESRRSFTFRVEVMNTVIDPQYIRRGPFKDVTTVRVTVGDVNEPPYFSQDPYILNVQENLPPGTLVGVVEARDPDLQSRSISYSIDPLSDPEALFSIDPEDGTIGTSTSLDREIKKEHSITVMATENDSPSQVSQVGVVIQVLDVNDNPPTLAEVYKPHVCDNAQPGQIIQTIQVKDADVETGVFSIRSPAAASDGNFTIQDNKDGSASLLVKHSSFWRSHKDLFLVPIEITDNGDPPLSSTDTLTVSLCHCEAGGEVLTCHMTTGSAAGLSTPALLAILACAFSLLALVSLFYLQRRHKPSPLSLCEDEDIRENIITYDDEGGGEQDTQAFDMSALQPPQTGLSGGFFHPPRMDVLPRVPHQPAPRSPQPAPVNVQRFLALRLREAERDPVAPPYDSIQVYGFEGGGSSAGSLSSLTSSSGGAGEDETIGDDIWEWGPHFRTLAEIYGAKRRNSVPDD